MKKTTIVLLFIAFTSITSLGADSLGLVSSNSDLHATYSVGPLEIEAGLTELGSQKLYISADYNLLGSGLSIGGASGFFWNGALGANLTVNSFSIGIISPWEFGYSFPVLKTGLDVYAQAMVGYGIYPMEFISRFGIGVRIGL